MSPELEIQLIAALVAVACALPGCFLVLRRMSMMSDAITHTLLLGIVLAFLATHSLTSPLLILGAASVGLLTVWLAETLQRSRRVSEDSAIGLTFPLLFSIAIILITHYADSVHLDADAVLLGELAFAPFDRMIVGGADLGPKAVWSMGCVALLNLAALLLFFKELKLATFDPILAALLGFAPAWLHYGLMASVSVTAVAAFQAVGSILVVAFMVGPPAGAYLLTDDLRKMIALSAVIGVLNALAGYWAAAWLDVSIAGSIAVATGLSFLGIFVLSPSRGLLSAVRRRARQKMVSGVDCADPPPPPRGQRGRGRGAGGRLHPPALRLAEGARRLRAAAPRGRGENPHRGRGGETRRRRLIPSKRGSAPAGTDPPHAILRQRRKRTGPPGRPLTAPRCRAHATTTEILCRMWSPFTASSTMATA